jgi:hypothetical protein
MHLHSRIVPADTRTEDGERLAALPRFTVLTRGNAGDLSVPPEPSGERGDAVTTVTGPMARDARPDALLSHGTPTAASTFSVTVRPSQSRYADRGQHPPRSLLLSVPPAQRPPAAAAAGDGEAAASLPQWWRAR